MLTCLSEETNARENLAVELNREKKEREGLQNLVNQIYF